MRLPRTLALVFAILVMAGTALAGCSSTSVDHRYVIPNGTAAKLAKGGDVVVMPSNLQVKVGDTITIVNNDVVEQSIGPYYVGAGETLHQTFTSATVLQGDCPLTADGAFKITVTE
jgi:plastocyanin